MAFRVDMESLVPAEASQPLCVCPYGAVASRGAAPVVTLRPVACWQQHWQHTSLADPPRPRGCDRSVPRAQQQLLREGSQVEVLKELIRMEQNSALS